MLVACSFAQDAQLQLLLLIFHFFLAFQKDLGHNGQRLLNRLVLEADLLNLIPRHLPSPAGSAAVILEAGATWLDHVELKPLVHVMDAEDHRRANGPVRCVDRAHLELERDPVGEGVAWDLHVELVLVLLAFFTCFLDDSAAVWDQTINDSAAIEGDRIKTFVRSRHHHFVDNDLLGSHDHAVLALDAQNGTKERKGRGHLLQI